MQYGDKLGPSNIKYLGEAPKVGNDKAGIFECPKCGKDFQSAITNIRTGRKYQCRECGKSAAAKAPNITYKTGDLLGPYKIKFIKDVPKTKTARQAIFECPSCQEEWCTFIANIKSGKTKQCSSCGNRSTALKRHVSYEENEEIGNHGVLYIRESGWRKKTRFIIAKCPDCSKEWETRLGAVLRGTTTRCQPCAWARNGCKPKQYEIGSRLGPNKIRLLGDIKKVAYGQQGIKARKATFECPVCQKSFEARISSVNYGSTTQCVSCGRKSTGEQLKSFSKEEELTIVRQYEAGESAFALAREHKVMDTTIKKIIIRNGGEYRGIPPMKLAGQEELVIEMYKSGLTLMRVGEQFNVSDKCIQRLLNCAGVEIREACPTSESIQHLIDASGRFFGPDQETELYAVRFNPDPSLIKIGIARDLDIRADHNYGEIIILKTLDRRQEAWVLEQAIQADPLTGGRVDGWSGWVGSTELRRTNENIIEKLFDYYLEELEELGVWNFALKYLRMTSDQRTRMEILGA